ncbi:MAG TPA: chemotaxis protein CheB [Dokdonella sp.]|uniref:chemotaxis protein CheB n=1 Tax=Dokdonella sp. TaxID=2291710 RepID=UPI002C3D8434|nr:chemotaxis protein CheB [Dokdonella sp.]HUD41952.1 chemotaxis protein CheB [Dokdonella sp.]
MSARPVQAIVVGTSAGGLRALHVLLRGLDRALPVPTVIVSHTGSSDMGIFCELLAHYSRLPVEEARERVRPRPGVVYVAPSGYHLLVERSGRFALSIDAKVGFSRPSIDVLFESAAETWGSGLVAVILTGANHDGAAGLCRVRACGGVAIVQDPATAEAAAMPEGALALAGADHCLPLEAIAPLLNRMCHA